MRVVRSKTGAEGGLSAESSVPFCLVLAFLAPPPPTRRLLLLLLRLLLLLLLLPLLLLLLLRE